MAMAWVPPVAAAAMSLISGLLGKRDDGRVKELQSQIAKLQADHATDDAKKNKMLEDLKQEQSNLADQIKQKEAALQKLGEQLTNINNTNKDLRAELTKIKEEEKDPNKLRQHEDRIFNNFVQAVQKENMSANDLDIIRQSRQINACFVGKVSVGKSSFINAFFGKRVAKTGAGRTTAEAREYGKIKTMQRQVVMNIFDVPGDDETFDYFQMDKVSFLASMHILIIAYDDTPSYSKRLTSVALALGKTIIFVRNKLDNIDPKEINWQDELRNDKAMIERDFRVQRPILFGVSARNSLCAKEEAIEAEKNDQYIPKIYEQFQWHDFFQCVQDTAEMLYQKSQGST